MFTRILVPLEGTMDGSAREEQTFAAARCLAEREGAQLVLLHVDADAASAQAATRAEMLDRSQPPLSHDGTHASIRFAYAPHGAIDHVIGGAAREEDADLIVISPRQRPLLQTLLRPGVTAELLCHAPAPVLVWPEGLRGIELDAALDATSAPIIVPLDGSPEAERALALAQALAKEHGRTLLLVTVAEPNSLLGVEAVGLGSVTPAEGLAPEGRLQEGLRYLQRMRKKVAAHTGLPVQTMGRIGPVAPTIADLAEAHPGCLVVMTTHGRGHALRLLLGGVATELLRLTPAPLLIVPPARPSAHGQVQPAATFTTPKRVQVEKAEAAEAAEAAEDDAEPEEAFGPVPTF